MFFKSRFSCKAAVLLMIIFLVSSLAVGCTKDVDNNPDGDVSLPFLAFY